MTDYLKQLMEGDPPKEQPVAEDQQQEINPQAGVQYVHPNATNSYLDALPKVSGPSSSKTSMAVEVNKDGSTNYLMSLFPEAKQQMQQGRVEPQDVSVKGDAVVKISDEFDEGVAYGQAGSRKNAQRIIRFFGEGGRKAAEILYGKDVIDSLPNRHLPIGYEGAYIQDGKWYVPGVGQVEEPPKTFLQNVPEKNIVERTAKWILPDALVDWEDRLYELINGPPSVQMKAMQDFSMAALELLSMKNVGAGGVVDGSHNVADYLFKKIMKAGITPPRLLMKGLARIEGEYLLPMREQAWEWITWPLTKKIIPTYEGGAKSIAEIFQPAVERLQKIKMDLPFREGQAQRQLVQKVGEDLGNQVKYLSLQERVEFGKALRGESVQSQKVKDLVKGMKKRIYKIGLDNRYKEHFYTRLEDLSKKMDFGYGVEAEMPFLKQVANQLGTSVEKRLGVKETQGVLKQMIENPLLPKSAKALALDLHNMPMATPEAVANASRYAMRRYVTDFIKASPYAKMAIGGGDNASEWLLSKHPFMKGLYVNRDIELELRALEEIPKMAQRHFGKWFMTPWKTLKVVARPATHFRNTISNMILNDWGGLPFYRMDIYKRAFSEMRGKTKLWKEFERLTGAGGTFSSEEVNQLAAGLKYGSNMFDYGMAMFDRVMKPARQLYNAEEQYAKFAKFIWNKGKGMESREAAYDAMKWTFNYGEVTRSTAFIRNYLAPFYTWQSKVIPLMAQTLVHHPWRVMKYYAYYKGIQAASLSRLRISDDEWERFQHILPDYIQEGQMLLLPTRDHEGRLQMLNLTYMIPGFGDFAEITANPASDFIGHPLMVLAGEIRMNRKFSGAPIYYDWEAPSTKLMKVFAHTWEQMAPSWAPGGFGWNKMMDTMQEVEGSPTWEQMAASSVGMKIVPINEMAARRSRRVIDNIHRSEIASQMKRELREARSTRDRTDIIEKYSRLQRQLVERRR